MRVLLVLAVIFLASNNAVAQQASSNAWADAYTATCQDVIDAKDEAAMSRSMISVRKLAFNASAKHQAEVLYNALQEQGVTSPLSAVLDYYVTVLIPVRDESGAAFDHMISQNGSLKNTITKLCPERKKDMFSFFTNFYNAVYEKHSEMQSKMQSKQGTRP